MFLKPYPRRWIDGNVDNPESIVRPVTPMEIGEVLLVNPDNLPHENVPTFVPSVERPVTSVVDKILTLMFATLPPDPEGRFNS